MRRDINSGKHKNVLNMIKDSPTKVPPQDSVKMIPNKPENTVIVSNKKGLVSFK